MATNDLAQKFKTKKAKVCIIGMGYVGIPLALRFVEVGFDILGFDIDERKVKAINSKQSYLNHISSSVIAQAVESQRFSATSDAQLIKRCDAIIVCVPTPLTKNHDPDLSCIEQALNTIKPNLRAGMLLSLESTTYPGTCDDLVVPMLKQLNYEIGKDIFLVYSPEREDPGRTKHSTRTTPKVIGGHTPTCLEMGLALYGQAVDKMVPVSSTKTAEMTKLLENIYRAVNIGMVNELKIISDRMGINIWEVIDAAATKPFGFTPFHPGPGLGGHCIPVDPFYLSWKSKEFGINARFIELAGETNRAMPAWVVEKIADALNQDKLSINAAKLLVLGVTYKPNIDDCRESPALEIIEMLLHKGANLSYVDPFVRNLGSYIKGCNLDSIDLNEQAIKAADLVVLLTDHDSFDYPVIYEYSRKIIDTRGRFKNQKSRVVFA